MVGCGVVSEDTQTVPGSLGRNKAIPCSDPAVQCSALCLPISERPSAGLVSALLILSFESTAHRLCIWVKGTQGFRFHFSASVCCSSAGWPWDLWAQCRDCPFQIKHTVGLWQTPALGHPVGDTPYTEEWSLDGNVVIIWLSLPSLATDFCCLLKHWNQHCLNPSTLQVCHLTFCTVLWLLIFHHS